MRFLRVPVLVHGVALTAGPHRAPTPKNPDPGNHRAAPPTGGFDASSRPGTGARIMVEPE